MKKDNSIFWNLVLVVVVLATLTSITIYSINLLNARSRDAQRISDLSNLKSAIIERYKMNNDYPPSGYKDLNLGIFFRQMPQDPKNTGDFKYHYISKGNSFVLFAKLEKPNYYGQTDGGKYNKKPLYYEVGSGHSWHSLIPNGFK